jgi:hypothetical protein
MNRSRLSSIAASRASVVALDQRPDRHCLEFASPYHIWYNDGDGVGRRHVERDGRR